MGGVLKAVSSVVGSIAKVAMPILDLAKLIPGVGQIAGVVKAGLSIASNISNIIKKGFPGGLLDAAKLAITNFAPAPLDKIADFAMGAIDKVKDMVPAAVKNFIPKDILPLPKGLGDLLA
jgi:hypothetical protein